MRIRKLTANNVPPIQLFDIEDVSDLVVVAGPNGVGKTRLISAFINYIQNPNGDNVSLEISATTSAEKEAWGKDTLNTGDKQDAQLLRGTLQKNQRRRNFQSSVLYYESNRSIQNIKPLAYEWDIPDPWEEQVNWQMTFGGLANRFTDTLHAIFRKIQNQKTSIASRAIELKRQGHSTMNLEFKDPLDPFREAFSQLLGPKELVGADLRANTLKFSHQGNEYDINALSSGEREVLNIVFDFLLRKPSDCIVFFDEPELHLHPELSSKLISTLKSAGKNNQFILCSHSPDIISSSLDDTVVFLTPPKNDGSNQAVVLTPNDESTEALNRLGHSIGVVSLGKKIVLIEGTSASLDKQTYVHILKNRNSELSLLPSGGKGNLTSFDKIADTVLNQSIWGVDFFMLADRDAVSDGASFEEKAPGRFRTLSRYHLENYFLDEQVLASVFEKMEPDESWLRDPKKIREALREIARNHIAYAAALVVANKKRLDAGNIDVMLKGCQSNSLESLVSDLSARCVSESKRIEAVLAPQETADLFTAEFKKIEKSIDEDSEAWKADIPGKPIVKAFCSKAQIPEGRLKSLYIQNAEGASKNPFEEIIGIFDEFSSSVA